MSVINKIVPVLFFTIFAAHNANALEYTLGNNSFKITGYGTAGMINPDIEIPVFIGDWRVRGMLTNTSFENTKFGLVYALDQAALDKGYFSREAFGFIQLKSFGRLEFGFTDSIARKLRQPVETLESLSQKYGISRERVRQIEERAYNKLRDAILKESEGNK